MLLTETIKQSITAMQDRQRTLENERSADNYADVLRRLSKVGKDIRTSLNCAKLMQDNRIVTEPLMDEATRQGLLDCIDTCGNAVLPENMGLKGEHVDRLYDQGKLFSAHLQDVWPIAAKQYSDGPRGYLAIISGFTADPAQARELTARIASTASAEPTAHNIRTLASDVAAAKKITDSFAMNSAIETFLKKVAINQATIQDLTPEVLDWLRSKNLMNKLKVRF